MGLGDEEGGPSVKMFRVTSEGLEETSNLDSNEVIIVMDEENQMIWVWRGKLTRSISHYQASIKARKLKSNEDMKRAKIFYVDEGDEPKSFPKFKHAYADIAEVVKASAELPSDLTNGYNDVLKELIEKTEIKTAVISSREGLPVASMDRESLKNLEMTDEVMIAGMTASLLSVGTKTSLLFKNDDMEQLIIKSKDGQLMVREIDEENLMICNFPLSSSLGVTILALNKSIKQLRDLSVNQ